MLAASFTLVTATLVASAGVDVRSSTECPSSREIAAQLRPLLEADAVGAAPDVAIVERAPGVGELRIRLLRANGSEVGDRRVPVQGECADAAATVAAVIAAWETEPLALAASNERSPASSAVAVEAAAPSRLRIFVGAGGGALLAGGLAAAGRLEATLEKPTSRWQGRIGAVGETSRSRSLSGGSVDWRHTVFEATLVLRTMHPVWRFSFEAGAQLGWATLHGRGFSDDRDQVSLEYGGVAALRVARSLGRWSVWGEARGHGWPHGQRASISGDYRASTDLPRLDLTASLGLSAPVLW